MRKVQIVRGRFEVGRIGQTEHDRQAYQQQGDEGAGRPNVSLEAFPAKVLEESDAWQQADGRPWDVGRIADLFGLTLLQEVHDHVAQADQRDEDHSAPGPSHFSENESKVRLGQK